MYHGFGRESFRRLTMEIKNEERFTGKANVYKRFRASYPKQLIDYLYTLAGFRKDSIIADIGSGTGIFGRYLLDKGSHVICVEPNDDMRLIFEKEMRDIAEAKKFSSVNASAENTGLKEKSIDFITTAQAFHWFDRQKFKIECRRILKDSGKVVLVWNLRDYEHEIVKKDYIIRKKFSVGDAKGLSSGEKSLNEFSDFFTDNICEELTFRNDLYLEREDYIGMNLSRSYAPVKEKNLEKYNGFVMALGNLFDEFSSSRILCYPHITKGHIGRV